MKGEVKKFLASRRRFSDATVMEGNSLELTEMVCSVLLSSVLHREKTAEIATRDALASRYAGADGSP